MVLLSSDGKAFEVERGAALLSGTIRNMIEDTGGGDGTVPLPNVKATVLARVVQYCIHRSGTPTAAGPGAEALGEWERHFLSVDQTELYDIIIAANYLDIPCLLDLCCSHVAEIIRGNTPEGIRQYFNITNDFTPAEEEEIARENEWAFA